MSVQDEKGYNKREGLIPNTTKIWRTDQPKPDFAAYAEATDALYQAMLKGEPRKPVTDNTWTKCQKCNNLMGQGREDYHRSYCVDYSYAEYLNLKNGYPAKKYKDKEPFIDHAHSWNEDPSNLMFPASMRLKDPEPEKTSFLILWTSFGQYEFVKDWPASPHEYVWGHDKYKISPYIIIPIDKLPKKFKQTPEDNLLDEKFGKQ